MKRLLTGGTVSLLSLALSLLLAEAALRLFMPVSLPGDPNPWEKYVGWAGNPHQVWVYNTSEFRTVVRYNSKGLRDHEYPYEKPEGTFRILFVGDSYVEAVQVEWEDSCYKLLEKRLNENPNPANPIKYETISEGVSGWGSDNVLLYYTSEGYRYDPDLVIYMFTSNDVADAYPPYFLLLRDLEDISRYKPYFTLEGEELELHNYPMDIQVPQGGVVSRLKLYMYSHSMLYRTAIDTVKSRLEQAAGVQAGIPEEPTGGVPRTDDPTIQKMRAAFVYARDYRDEYYDAWELSLALIKRFEEETARRGDGFALVANAEPFIYAVDDPAVPIDGRKVGRILAEYTAGNDIHFMDMGAGFSARLEDPSEIVYHHEKDGHMNEKGHTLCAELLYQWLISEELIPSH